MESVKLDKFAVLKEFFGYSSFRNGQEDIIDNILSGHDVLGVMPTGAGKSLCYQVPALMLSGVTIVISPLISLMKDQVQALSQNNISAAFINSTLSYREVNNVFNSAVLGKYKIIYVAPERLGVPEFLELMDKIDVSMVAVDEAHCVSQWGQDFRPSYLEVCEFIRRFKRRPVVSAFTATATAEVKEDIVRLLKLNSPFVLTTGYNRSNLYFGVSHPKDKYEAVVKYLNDNKGKSGIIYCVSRKLVEEVSDKLVKDGFNATRYHAGLSDKERKKNQDDFIYDVKNVMVATNAFGMGIDKSNVSFVIHYNMPKDIESYYQEAGRAGRDGSPAECILLYGGQDVVTNSFLIEHSDENNTLTPAAQEEVKEKERERLKRMTFYCHTTDCLREYMIKYFGENTPNFCGNCSNCNSNFEEVDVTVEAQKILSCVYRMKERYGVKLVVDTLRGSESEKVLRLKLNSLSTYGIMKDVKEKRIRDIINFLTLNSYVFVTDSEYPVIKLGKKANDVLFHGEKLIMKMAREVEKPVKSEKKLADVDEGLFRRLKELRTEIAKREKVPAFIVFSDAALIDMCRKKPKCDFDFLDVSGVGQAKLRRYGSEFIKSICEYEGS